MADGKRRLERALKGALDGKEDKPILFKGLLGAYVAGVKTIKVAERPDFVWVRLRGATGEVIQAFNDNVAEHFDLPVFVSRDPKNPHIWRIEGRDIGQYGDWGGASYLPPHGRTHTFVGGADSGSDPVFIAKRQYMELLPRPNYTGSQTIYIEPGYYFWDGYYHYWPGSGTASLLPYIPTGSTTQRFVTVYLDGNSLTPGYLMGDEFSIAYPPSDPTTFIAVPDVNEGIPIAAVRLLTGTDGIGWHDIYDLRLPPAQLPGTGSTISIFDESNFLGTASGFNFVGEGIEVNISGSYAHIFVTGTGGVAGIETGTATYLLVGQPEPLESLTGTYWRTPGGTPYATGSLNAFIDGLSQVKDLAFEEQFPASGTYRYLFTPPTGVLHELKFGTPVDVSIAIGPQGPPGPTGTAGEAGAQGPPGAFGVFVTDEGVPLGTGTILDFVGEVVDASISGSVVRVFVTGSTGGAAGGSGSVVLYDEESILGSVENLVAEGGGITAARTGTFGYLVVTGTPGSQGPPGAPGAFGVNALDDGILLGTGTYLDFRGAGVTASISGSFVDIFIPSTAPGGGVDQIGVYGLDNGEHLGTGTWLDFGASLDASISGTTIRLDVAHPDFPQQQIGFYAIDDGFPLGTGTWIDAGDDLTASISGTVVRLDVTHPSFPAFPEEQIGTYVLDEGVALGTGTWLEFEGAGVVATISGTTVLITIPGGSAGAEQIGIYGLDDGVPLGTGSWLDFGDDLNASISGTVIRLDAVHPDFPAFPQEEIGVYVLDEGIPVGTGTWLDFVGAGVEATISGTTVLVSIQGPQAPGSDQIGFYALEDGVPLGTGSWLDAGDDLTASISGSVVRLDVTHPSFPAFPEEEIGIFGLDDGVPLGTGTWLDIGDRLSVSLSGTTLRLDADVQAPTFPEEVIGVYLTDEGVPIGTGTTLDFAGQITDVTLSGTVARIFISGAAPVFPQEEIGVYVLEEGAPLGTGTWLDFQGAGVDASISGTTVLISIQGPQAPGSDQIGIYGLDDGVPLGTGSWLDAGDYISASLSGTTLRLDVNLPPEPVDQIGFYGLDDGVPLGTGTWLNVGDNLTFSISGTTFQLDAVLPPEPAEQIGFYALDDGVPLGTGTTLDAGDDLSASLSGTVLRLDVVHPDFPEEVIGMYVLDEGIPLGTGTWIDFVGGGVEATLSGTVATITIPQNTLPPVTGTVVMLNEGWVSGSFPQIDVAGEWIDLRVSGSRATILVPDRALSELRDVDISGIQDWDFLRLSFASGKWVNTPLPPAAYTGSVVVYDESVFVENTKELRFIGDGVQAFNSGSYVVIAITGSIENVVFPQEEIGFYALEDGVPLGTGSWLDAGDDLTASISGTVVRLDVTHPTFPAFPEEEIGVYGLNNGVPLGTGTWVDFRNNITATISGSVITIDGQAGGGGGEQLGAMVWDEGVPLQTGTIFNFVGDGVTASISGTVANISIPGLSLAGSGSTYVRAGNPIPLTTQTGGYWKITDPEFATGSLSVAVNGVWQQPTIDYQEQYAASGTFTMLTGLETGSLLSAIWGVPASGGTGGDGTLPEYDTVWVPAAPPITGSAYDDEFDDADPTGTLWTIFDPDGDLDYVVRENLGCIELSQPVSTGDIIGFIQPLPSNGSGTFSAYARLSHMGTHSGDNKAGIVMCEDAIANPTTSDLRIYVLGEGGYGSAIQIERASDYQTIAGNDYNETQAHATDWEWLRVRRDSSGNIYLDVSQDGLYWQQINSTAEAFTAKEIGIFVRLNQTSHTVRFWFFRFLEDQDDLELQPAGRLVRMYKDT